MVDKTAVDYVPVDKAGDTMAGILTLSGAPVADLDAATKKYVDDNVSAGDANTALSNLAAVAINTSLVSDTDLADNLGSGTIRWDSVFAESILAGDLAGNVLAIGGRDVDGAISEEFITITSNNTPTCVLSKVITSTTQAPLTSNTTLATTEYVDDAVAAGGGSGADTALSNLAAVAINTSLVSDTDVTDNLGSLAIRWNNIYGANVSSGDTAADVLTISAYDVDGAASAPFITLTSNNTPTCVIDGAVTGTTQAPLTTNTTIATTKYCDDAVAAAAPVAGANTALSNLAAVAINTSLISDTTNTDDLGSAGILWKDAYATRVLTDSIELGAAETDTTLTRVSAGDVNIEGNIIYRAGGTDVPVTDGGNGRSTATEYAVICGGTTATGAHQSIAGLGTAGQLLTSNGAGALPTFQDGGGGGALVYLSTVTVSAAATADLDNIFDGTYYMYKIFANNVAPANDSVGLLGRMGTGAGPTYDTGANYSAAASFTTEWSLATNWGNAASEAGAFELTVFNANSTTRVKQFRMIGNGCTASTTARDINVFMLNTLTTACTSLRFYFATGNVASATFKIYGVSGS